MRILKWIAISLVLALQGLGVITPVLFRSLPGYKQIFVQLWERHKNPVSWVCRPFFGLTASYGAILHNRFLLSLSITAIGTSWFWFPKPAKTPQWAEDFIDRELEIMTPENVRDFKRVVLPSIVTPLVFGGYLVILWTLRLPWNWLALSGYTILSIAKIFWSVGVEKSVARPLILINLAGYILGIIVGIPLFFFQQV